MHGDGLEPDTWDRGPDGFRTCSYCGSLHHDDFVEICGRTLIDERYSVERSTKSYKFYVRQPGVRNAGEGAIKFYTHHCPDVIPDQQQETFGEAIRLSHRRFQERMQRQYAV